MNVTTIGIFSMRSRYIFYSTRQKDNCHSDFYIIESFTLCQIILNIKSLTDLTGNIFMRKSHFIDEVH